ncbi:MAG: type II toxin-antitoxin system RelE/ParE family toxin [Deltaproteobacteria bacterium]|nr:type II toxin-antitoxin system RelE/ParE family toxin [Deltaproteobacteria bacterium]
MASYELKIKPSAAKELEGIGSKKDRQRIVARISSLAVDPRPPGCQKLSGSEKYRVRQGVYRILYTVDDEIVTVVVIRIAHRRDVYR